jgi:DNA-binding transcriptional ArsR family regulator
MSGNLDFRDHRLSDTELQGFKKRRLPRVREKRFYSGPFVQGPIPLKWLQLAMKLGGACLSVGLILWYLRGLKKSITFKVGLKELADLIGRSWQTTQRALSAIEKANLITIERREGRKHRIIIEDKEEKVGSRSQI